MFITLILFSISLMYKRDLYDNKTLAIPGQAISKLKLKHILSQHFEVHTTNKAFYRIRTKTVYLLVPLLDRNICLCDGKI